jgi:hypothetical protein
MTHDTAPSPPERDPDLVRWASELGVTYEELRSTLNYAGPTFKDGVVDLSRQVETPVSPTGTAAPALHDSGNTPGALAPGIAAATQLPR